MIPSPSAGPAHPAMAQPDPRSPARPTLNRRRFLTFLGLAPVTAPLASKAALHVPSSVGSAAAAPMALDGAGGELAFIIDHDAELATFECVMAEERRYIEALGLSDRFPGSTPLPSRLPPFPVGQAFHGGAQAFLIDDVGSGP